MDFITDPANQPIILLIGVGVVFGSGILSLFISRAVSSFKSGPSPKSARSEAMDDYWPRGFWGGVLAALYVMFVVFVFIWTFFL